MNEGIPNNEAIIAELIQIVDRTNADKALSSKVVAKSRELQSKYPYPDFTKYALHYVLASGSPGPEVEYFDFPGDDSVEKFLRSL